MLLLLLFGCIMFTSPRLEADPRIDAIKAQYEKVREIENDASSEWKRHDLVINIMYHVVGLEKMQIQFYHEDEVHPSIDPNKVNERLLKVKMTYNVSTSVYYTIEYLFNDKGEFVFYFWQEKITSGPITSEKRFYFDLGALFMVNVSYHTASGQNVAYIGTDQIKKEEQEAAAGARALDYKTLFESIVAAEKWK
jgi:hypothetical protein